jgi:chromate transporter
MQILGCFIGTIALFLPSALLLFFFFPVWQYHLKKYVIVYRALEGINSVIVGFIWAAALYLLHGLNLFSLNHEIFINLLIITSTFLIVNYTKLPTQYIVITCVLAGIIF